MYLDKDRWVNAEDEDDDGYDIMSKEKKNHINDIVINHVIWSLKYY